MKTLFIIIIYLQWFIRKKLHLMLNITLDTEKDYSTKNKNFFFNCLTVTEPCLQHFCNIKNYSYHQNNILIVISYNPWWNPLCTVFGAAYVKFDAEVTLGYLHGHTILGPGPLKVIW